MASRSFVRRSAALAVLAVIAQCQMQSKTKLNLLHATASSITEMLSGELTLPAHFSGLVAVYNHVLPGHHPAASCSGWSINTMLAICHSC